MRESVTSGQTVRLLQVGNATVVEHPNWETGKNRIVETLSDGERHEERGYGGSRCEEEAHERGCTHFVRRRRCLPAGP